MFRSCATTLPVCTSVMESVSQRAFQYSNDVIRMCCTQIETEQRCVTVKEGVQEGIPDSLKTPKNSWNKTKATISCCSYWDRITYSNKMMTKRIFIFVSLAVSRDSGPPAAFRRGRGALFRGDSRRAVALAVARVTATTIESANSPVKNWRILTSMAPSKFTAFHYW